MVTNLALDEPKASEHNDVNNKIMSVCIFTCVLHADVEAI